MEQSGDLPKGKTKQWIKETKNIKKLPEEVKEKKEKSILKPPTLLK
jgi:hypothetical protein